MAGKDLLAAGHEVIFHARNRARAGELKREVPGASKIVVGDISTVAGAMNIADQVNAIGRVDAVIHNAGLGADTALRLTSDGVPDLFGVNVLAPYVLTAQIDGPTRNIYLSSDMHYVSPNLDDPLWCNRRWNGYAAYSESKLYATALAFAVARLRPEVRSNAVDPGWVPTRMGGPEAPDDLEHGAATQVALAMNEDDVLSRHSGQYFYHMAVREPERSTRDSRLQEHLLTLCQELSGVSISAQST